MHKQREIEISQKFNTKKGFSNLDDSKKTFLWNNFYNICKYV